MDLTLGQLRDYLTQFPLDRVVQRGFSDPHSYRGYYDHVSFAPGGVVTVAKMLDDVDRALTDTFTGYKGGEFKYDVDTPVHFAPYGYSDGDDDSVVTKVLLSVAGVDTWY